MKPKPLTPREVEVLDMIAALTLRDKVPPSYQDLAQHLHIHTGTVVVHVEHLEAKGAIKRIKGARRSIEII